MRDEEHARMQGRRVQGLPGLTGMLALLLASQALVTGWARGLQAETGRLSSIRSVMESPVKAPFRVRGTVTRVGGGIILQDETAGVEALPIKTPMVEVGDEVEVTGEAAMRSDKHVLRNAVVVALWHSSPPPPLALLPDDAADGEHNDVLVQVEGRLLHVANEGGMVRLQMEGGHQFYAAELPHSESVGANARRRLLTLPVNSRCG